MRPYKKKLPVNIIESRLLFYPLQASRAASKWNSPDTRHEYVFLIFGGQEDRSQILSDNLWETQGPPESAERFVLVQESPVEHLQRLLGIMGDLVIVPDKVAEWLVGCGHPLGGEVHPIHGERTVEGRRRRFVRGRGRGIPRSQRGSGPGTATVVGGSRAEAGNKRKILVKIGSSNIFQKMKTKLTNTD